MKRPLFQALGGMCLIGIVVLVACTRDTPVAPTSRIAIPTSPLAIWISPQPCQISLFNPFNDNQYFGTTIPTTGTVCDVRWHLAYPPNFSVYRGIWWHPDIPPSQPYTLFATGPSYRTYQNGPIEIVLDSAVKDFSLVLSRERADAFDTSGVLSPGIIWLPTMPQV